MSMTKKNLDFKVPAVKRAIRVAHSQQLVVDSYDIKPDGTIHVQLAHYEVTPGGGVRADTFSRRDLQELIEDTSDRLKTVVDEGS